jgi:GNAT superfamily N-acetyltransferase
MNIKQARAEDLADLLQLVIEYQEEYEGIVVTADEVIEKFLADLMTDEQRGALFIGRTSTGSAVGFAVVYLCPSARNAEFAATLTDLFISLDYREKGFGGHLFEHVVKWAKKRNYPKLIWTVENMNMTAQYMFDKVEGASQVGWIGYMLNLEKE